MCARGHGLHLEPRPRPSRPEAWDDDEVEGIDPFRWLPYEVEHIGWSRTATGRNRLAEAEQIELHCVVLGVRSLLHGDRGVVELEAELDVSTQTPK